MSPAMRFLTVQSCQILHRLSSNQAEIDLDADPEPSPPLTIEVCICRTINPIVCSNLPLSVESHKYRPPNADMVRIVS